MAIVVKFAFAQDPISIKDTLYVPEDTTEVPEDTIMFSAMIPANYSADSPPAILIWWHQLGGMDTEAFAFTDFDSIANLRGWILASHFGPNDRHWNTRRPQKHCRIMLDWIDEHYPFSHDSIYMIGGSMGGAAGQVWNNNNCGINDYLIAATAGGSQIIDCQLRQQQYLDGGDTNRSMRAAFGGVPVDGDSVLFEYHRYSAVFLADTTKSMHFNSLSLPVWSSWGEDQAEWDAYGTPAQSYLTLRGTSEPFSRFFPSGMFGAHGLEVMPPDTVCNWLSQFAVNRYPDELSINADEDDVYYYTKAYLAGQPYTFGRYAISKNFEERRLDITAIRNIRSLAIGLGPDWETYDEISGTWASLDAAVPDVGIRLCSVPPVQSVVLNGNQDVPFQYDDGDLYLTSSPNGEVTITFVSAELDAIPEKPQTLNITAAYPNPFNSTITLQIKSLQEKSELITLRDILGRIAVEIPIQLHVGVNSVSMSGENMASGIYFVSSPTITSPIKIVLLK